MAALLLVALILHTALGLLPDPAPPMLHRGFGTVVLALSVLWIGRERRFVIAAAILLLVLGLVTQTPLAFRQSGTPTPELLHAIGMTELRRAREPLDLLRLADLQSELLRRNAPALDLRALPEELRNNVSSSATSPLLVEAALRLAIVGPSDIKALVQRLEYRQLFDRRQTRLALALPQHAAWVRLLILDHPLKEAARKNLTAALLEAMPTRAGAGALEAFVSGCRLLELLPGAVDGADLESRARTLLSASWVPPDSLLSASAGFGEIAAGPAQQHRFSTLTATRQACELIRRFGAPPSIDIERLRAALIAKLRQGTRIFRAAGSLGLEAALSLSALHDARGVAGPTIARVLIHERDLIAACCVAFLAMVAARRRRPMQPAEFEQA